MAKEEEVLMCPQCGERLNNKTYKTVSAYHNCMEGICGNCGFNAHWTCFWHTPAEAAKIKESLKIKT